ncbi:hypothetical protein XENTR_v10015143 [Xenopus tropicalis]|uniref:XK-related protein n=1 Tax=Xenopus tropicalis TaxID=8364 RepID=A0A803JMF4_XENTR|nr:XK-related protein 5 isoform X1 [Xenopus tropicalis]KAE8605447.1 hypothetical protein XENTR_v10015143 [Xenopus tropicalis]
MEASGSSVGCAAVSLLLYLMERGAELAVLVHYFLTGQYTWASCTLALLIPGCLVQALSFAWFRKEGPAGGFTVTLIHVLQLGILKRQADCLQVALREGKRQKPGNERELLMQQGDAALLRLVEALLQALPHLLLQTYIYLALEYTNAYAVASALLSLLSLSWALVSYSRFLCLLKPGHLSMPWASLLCQLLWRMGMIGTRAMALAVFARVYHFWVFAVAGAHWLVMSFWLVAQQTDLISRPCYWKLFNALVGAVYVFCFLNVRDGPSRYRVAIFYTVMLLENAILLLLATDFLQGVLWSNVRLTVVVMCGFLIGCAALIIYYTLLHPKSTQISQSFRKMAHVVRARRDTFPRNNHHGPSERADGDTFSTAANLKCPTSDSEGLVHWLQKSSRRHYWLLLKLAMKTGNVSKINTAFGDCDFGLTFSPGCPESIPNSGYTCIKHAESDHCRQPESPDFVILESERWVFGKTEVESASYVTLGKTGAEDNKVNEARGERNPGVSPSSRDAPQENGTLYFSANTEELLHSANVGPEKPGAASVEPIQTPTKEIPAQEGARTEVYPAICVSPILSLATNSNFQRSIAPDVGSLCDDSSMSNDEADVTEAEELPGERARLLLAPGLLAPSLRGRLIPEEKPCFTSTPKPQTASAEPGLREDSKTKRKLLEP